MVISVVEDYLIALGIIYSYPRGGVMGMEMPISSLCVIAERINHISWMFC